MQYAIDLYFDKETEEKLYNPAKLIADEGLSTKFPEWKTRPHLLHSPALMMWTKQNAQSN